MKQLTVISGKGGTGKTTIAAAFASLAKNAVLADCDVDAADLHLILDPDIERKEDFYGLKVARKDDEKCIDCGKCREHCRFEAIDREFNIMPEKCEGCGVCAYVCPAEAITLGERLSGYAYRSKTRFGPMAHARLNTAEEASGKLVTVVRDNARELAEEHGRDKIIIDGPPGIGCPVIAAITGVDLILIVTEPTVSGIHDMERILDVAAHFSVTALVCINKYDINERNTESIEEYCRKAYVEVVGKLPYDDMVTKAMIEEKSIIEFSDGELTGQINKMWSKAIKRLEQESPHSVREIIGWNDNHNFQR